MLTPELASAMASASFEINRQVGVLVDRRGGILFVVVGDHQKIVIPDLSRIRSGTERLKGIRCIHTHLKGEPLSKDDLNDLALLRLDMMAALAVERGGKSGKVFMAHLLPENPDEKRWEELPPLHPNEIDIPFQSFIASLEDELGRSAPAGRSISKTPKAILVSVTSRPKREADAFMAELRQLALSAGCDVIDEIIQHARQINPKYLMGVGKLQDLIIRALQHGANLLIFDQDLSPVQVKSITEVTDLRVMDRTQLILDIFAQRAHSREGRVKVELAQLKYIKPRLMAKDDALSRLTGGIGGRGPGETKLEVDRRRIDDRINFLNRELTHLNKGRETRKARRLSAGIPAVSIVGYTNAGKSTLFNALTGSSVLEEDRLFATLDTTSRKLWLKEGAEIILNDTVGFIRDLPKDLVDTFKSTLDELLDSSLLLHLVDACEEEMTDQIASVERILLEIGANEIPRQLVFNKIDAVDSERLAAILNHFGGSILVSAHTGRGIAELTGHISNFLFPETTLLQEEEQP